MNTPRQPKRHPLTRNNYGSGMSFFRYLAVRKTNDTTYTQSIQFQNACIIASSFSGVHCCCLAFSDLGKLKFSKEKSTFTFLLSTSLRSTSVRAEQRSTRPLAPFESKTTNRFNVACKWKTIIRCGTFHCIPMLCEIL